MYLIGERCRLPDTVTMMRWTWIATTNDIWTIIVMRKMMEFYAETKFVW